MFDAHQQAHNRNRVRSGGKDRARHNRVRQNNVLAQVPVHAAAGAIARFVACDGRTWSGWNALCEAPQ